MNPTVQQTNWLPGLVVLGLVFVAAALYLYFTRRSAGSAPVQGTPQLADLERRYQVLIEQLRELSAEQHHLPAEQYAAERSRLEHEAAGILRERDTLSRSPAPASARAAPAAAPAHGFFAQRPQLKGALWGAGIVLFFGVLSYLLVSEQRERDEDGVMTGRTPPGAQVAPGGRPAGPQGEDAELTAARERLRQNPGDLETSSLVGHELIRREVYDEALRVTNRALAVDPFHVESRVHRGVLRAISGDAQGGEQELRELVDLYPDAQEALLFLGAIAQQRGQKAEALAYFERFTAEVPAQQRPPQVAQAIARLRQELGR